MNHPQRVLVKGGGDLGTGVAWRLHRAGFNVLVTEVALPMVIRRAVAFAEAIYAGEIEIEGVTGQLIERCEAAAEVWEAGRVAVMVDPGATCRHVMRPVALVDAILAKHNTGTRKDDAPVVVALGPGFTAGVDCHAVVETQRGHDMGRVLLFGSAAPNTGVPGLVLGEGARRVLRAPAAGRFEPAGRIGDRVAAGDVVAHVDGQAVRVPFDGVLRGLLHEGLYVGPGFKVGDVDPRGIVEHCFTISDKALAMGGGALEAILYLQRRGVESGSA